MSLRVLILFALCLWPSISSAQWSNEPSGSTVALDCSFSGPTSGCGIANIYNSGAIVSDNDPVSPPGAYRSRIEAGQNFGGSQLEWNYSQRVREMYVGMMVRTNPEFAGRQVGNKMYFHGGGPGVGSGLFLFGGGGTQGATQKPIIWSFNSAKWDNQHISTPLSLGLVPNMSTCLMTTGAYTRLESYVRASTSYTSRDGIIRWWLNGTLCGDYSNVNYAPEGLSFWTWTETWDGTVNPAPSVPWEWYLGHLHISIPNCGSNCGGGGSADTTPPSQVTGVTVNSITSTGATISWSSASDNVAVAGYQAELCAGFTCTNFSNLQTTTVPSIAVTGRSAGTTYRFRVKAYDAAGNVSASYSTTVNFTTSGAALPSMTSVDADATGANVAWSGSPDSIRVLTDTLNIVEPMTAFLVGSDTIAHVQSRSVAGSGNSISLAYSSNNTAGNFLALRLVAVPSSVTISNCSDTRGNAWESVPNATGGTGGYQAIRFAKNVTAGANTVTCTLTGPATASILDIFEKSGVDRTSPLDQSKLTQQVDPGTGTDAISSGSVTTTADGELILGATLQVGSTVYSASGQFSGTQGPVWYYLDSAGTLLSWTGSYWQGVGYLSLWDTGGAPGNSLNTVRRWVAPADGAIAITGTSENYSGCSGSSNGSLISIKKNGTTIYSQVVGATGQYPYNVSANVVATDQIDFVLNHNGNDTCDSTRFDPTITLGTSSGSGGTTTNAGTGFTLRHATASDSPSEDKIQTSAGLVAATFTGADALNDYITSIATFKPAATSIRYSRNWPIGTTFVCMYPRDSDGNENTVSPGYRCDSVTPGADTTPPVRSGAQPSGTLAAGTTAATLSVSTNEFSMCRYDTSSGIAYGSMANALDASPNALFHSKEVTGLSNGNTYTYYVRCQDVFLNANTTDTTITFDVGSVADDVTAPSQVVGLQGTALNATQISLSWTASIDNVGVTGYEVYVADSVVDYTLGATSSTNSAILSGLSPNTLYLIKVRARDAVGNFGDDSDTIVVLTPLSDVTPPSDMTGLSVTAVDFQALDITWTAGSDNGSVPQTSIEMCQGSACTLFALAATVNAGTNTLRVSGLHPLTTYRFRGKHTDTAGNVSVNYSPIVSGTTPSVPSATVTAICPCKHHR